MKRFQCLKVIYIEDADLFIHSRLKKLEEIEKYDIKFKSIINDGHIVIFMRNNEYKILKSHI